MFFKKFIWYFKNNFWKKKKHHKIFITDADGIEIDARIFKKKKIFSIFSRLNLVNIRVFFLFTKILKYLTLIPYNFHISSVNPTWLVSKTPSKRIVYQLFGFYISSRNDMKYLHTRNVKEELKSRYVLMKYNLKKKTDFGL